LFDEQQVGFWPGIINFRTLSQILGFTDEQFYFLQIWLASVIYEDYRIREVYSL
jgi:hypothetical protein